MIYDKNHPLRVCTLCSGYDSQCLALKYLKDKHSEFDFDLVAWSEIGKMDNYLCSRAYTKATPP